MKIKLVSTLIFILIVSSCFSQTFEKQGAGVTIIVHGWNPEGNQPVWMTSMANEIMARSGGNAQIATINVTGSTGNLTASCSNWDFDMINAVSGEIIILVNWTGVANHLTKFVSAQEVAAAVVPKIYLPQNGQNALAELPIHLIGHSRGGGMVYEIARLLGLQGIEVDHLTSLDPHPLTESDIQPVFGTHTTDIPVAVYENILFVDNYHQNINYPTGQSVNGAFNRLWTSLPGGYHNETGYTYNILGINYNFSDHLNIILMYHGTIDLETPSPNGEATITQVERDAWFNDYENQGAIEGFYYSSDIAGDRKSTDIPVLSGDQIINGYHNDAILGGLGSRDALNWSNAVWPNILTIDVIKNSTLLPAGMQIVELEDQLQVQYNYRSYSNSCDVSIFVDVDRNPYNNNNVTTFGSENISSTDSDILQSTISWTVSGLQAGTKYYIYSKIDDGVHVRYIYSSHEFYVDGPVFPEITIQAQDQTNICPETSVDFSVTGNHIDSYLWQVSTDNGAIWNDIVDNETYSGATTSTLSVQAELSLNGYQYHCVASNDNGEEVSSSASLLIETENPTIMCVENQIINLEQDETNYIILGTEFDPISSDDNCGVASVTNSLNSIETLEDAELQVGTTTITWTVADIAGNVANCQFDVVVNAFVGIFDLSASSIHVFPNPSSGIVNVECAYTNASFNSSNIKKLVVRDVFGKKIIESTDILQNELIDLTGYESGIYLLSIQTDKEIFILKIVKQ
jgi:hypothetical protein